MQNMTLALRALMLRTVSVGIVFLGAPRDAFGHGKELEKKGAGPAQWKSAPMAVRSLISETDISRRLASQPEVCRSIAWTTT